MFLKKSLPQIAKVVSAFVIWGSLATASVAQQSATNRPVDLVNVFLGSSGDYGQMSPAASYPFSFLSILPQTYPFTHTGYEYLAKKVYGFNHNRMEGVGCQGSGGILFVRPIADLEQESPTAPLVKRSERAVPGYYQIGFDNGLEASFAVYQNSGLHQYRFRGGELKKRGLYIDLSHSFNNAFVEETHRIDGNRMVGKIRSRTTCHAGTYTYYFALQLSEATSWEELAPSKLLVATQTAVDELRMSVGFSSVSEEDAIRNLSTQSMPQLSAESNKGWNQLLQRIEVKGDSERKGLFYSLLYRTLQSPYLISDREGRFRNIDGSLNHSDEQRYNGWAIWDNYKTQLPLLSLAYSEIYQPIVSSIANLYPYGKKDYATRNEPSNTVRTEHAIVVLLDAYRKGYHVDFAAIIDELKAEVDSLSSTSPDKALETAYDYWALGQIYKILGQSGLSSEYLNKAAGYKTRWTTEFSDMTARDVDRMSARNMYQGTIRQYRWTVPFDIAGLKQLMGGDKAYIDELDDFFDNDYFNRTNEPDLHVPAMYQSSSAPWKSQYWMHALSVDTINNHYFNDNSRGIGSEIDVIFKNKPKAFIRTMDDDAGAMSGWYVWASMGLYPAAVGHPMYYIHLPLFEEVTIKGAKPFKIRVENYSPKYRYIDKATLNGVPFDRNWITQDEVLSGGELVLKASSTPNKNWGVSDLWESRLQN